MRLCSGNWKNARLNIDKGKDSLMSWKQFAGNASRKNDFFTRLVTADLMPLKSFREELWKAAREQLITSMIVGQLLGPKKLRESSADQQHFVTGKTSVNRFLSTATLRLADTHKQVLQIISIDTSEVNHFRHDEFVRLRKVQKILLVSRNYLQKVLSMSVVVVTDQWLIAYAKVSSTWKVFLSHDDRISNKLALEVIQKPPSVTFSGL